jgi:hypothetical protein
VVHWSHRFDDPDQQIRTVYCGDDPDTCFRETLQDLRPDTQEIAEFLETFGFDALAHLPREPVTAAWRNQHRLVRLTLELAGPLVDLTDANERYELEIRHAALLAEHDLSHLDLNQVTMSLRRITQRIGSDVRARLDAASIAFPSKINGGRCYAGFEGGCQLVPDGDPIELTESSPPEFVRVARSWRLPLPS